MKHNREIKTRLLNHYSISTLCRSFTDTFYEIKSNDIESEKNDPQQPIKTFLYYFVCTQSKSLSFVVL